MVGATPSTTRGGKEFIEMMNSKAEQEQLFEDTEKEEDD